MGVLKQTEHLAEIVWLGRVPAGAGQLASQAETRMFAAFSGVEGEAHAGLTRPSCSRVVAQYPKGTAIRNTRQFSVLAAEELALVAAEMGLTHLAPELLGASMVIRGIPDFSHVPPGARLQGEGGATLVVDLQNRPCTFPARGIEAAHPGHGARFKPAAEGRRGITAWVEREGWFAVGERLRLHVPDQRAWAHLKEARQA
jgi:hypothetical protein